ncbi:unnamed protein product [Urochloa humidicola]
MAVTVEVTRRAVLRPPPVLATGGGRKSPLTAFDRASTDGYIPAVFAWNAPAPDNAALVDGLLAAVARYPHLAGRFGVDGRGRRCFDLNDAGVLVVEAQADADLADALAQDVAAHINELYPKADKERADEPLFQAQLTRYRCGGLVIGTACQHLVADGQSMSFFYTAWATAVRTASAATLPTPFTDRSAIAIPRDPPTPTFDHRNTEFRGNDDHSHHSYPVIPLERIKNLTVHFSDDFVAALKSRARCSTFQCLLAHAWKKVTAARDLPPETPTQIRVAVNCRPRAHPPAPAEYFGNMVLWAFPRMPAREVLSSSYAAVAGAIRDAVARVDAGYVQSFVDFGEAAERAGEEELASTAAGLGTAFCPDLEVDSWLGFRFHDLDFGHGPPCAFLPPDLPVEGLMIFVPSCAAKGGVDLFLALDVDHVEAFKQICYSMD